MSCNGTREEGYRPALARALEDLKGLDPGKRGALCGGRPREGGPGISIRYFDRELIVSPDWEVSDGEGEAPVFTRLILLHYLARSDGAAPRRGR